MPIELIANEANVKLLVLYHQLPSPDGLLTQRLFSNGINEVRCGEWTIADDGSVYTMPLGSKGTFGWIAWAKSPAQLELVDKKSGSWRIGA